MDVIKHFKVDIARQRARNLLPIPNPPYGETYRPIQTITTVETRYIWEIPGWLLYTGSGEVVSPRLHCGGSVSHNLVFKMRATTECYVFSAHGFTVGSQRRSEWPGRYRSVRLCVRNHASPSTYRTESTAASGGTIQETVPLESITNFVGATDGIITLVFALSVDDPSPPSSPPFEFFKLADLSRGIRFSGFVVDPTDQMRLFNSHIPFIRRALHLKKFVEAIIGDPRKEVSFNNFFRLVCCNTIIKSMDDVYAIKRIAT